MNDLGRAGAYFALFSQIGIVLLTTTILGVLGGLWVDDELRTRPVFIVLCLLVGFSAGGLGVYRLVTRFLARFE